MSIFIDKHAVVETNNIGEKTIIWGNTHVLPGAQLGKENTIGEQCFIENKVITGDRVTIKNCVSLWDGLTVEDDVFIGPSVAFTNDLFPRSKNTSYTMQKTLLKKGSSIGANATIIGGISVGKYALVGAGAVVTKNVEDFAIVYGNPATHQGYVCVCGEKIFFKGSVGNCKCGRKYSKTDTGVIIYE